MSNLRTIPGVISTFSSLIILYFVGSAVFYKMIGSIDSTTLPATWVPLYDALNIFFEMGIGIYILISALLFITPLIWIFMGKKNGEDYRI